MCKCSWERVHSFQQILKGVRKFGSRQFFLTLLQCPLNCDKNCDEARYKYVLKERALVDWWDLDK